MGIGIGTGIVGMGHGHCWHWHWHWHWCWPIGLQGGNADRTGAASVDALRKVIKDDFAMALSVDDLIADTLGAPPADKGPITHLTFEQFQQLFT
jgi:hypothetical protein